MDLSISTATPRTGISKTDSHRCKVGEGFDFSQNCVLHVFFVFVRLTVSPSLLSVLNSISFSE